MEISEKFGNNQNRLARSGSEDVGKTRLIAGLVVGMRHSTSERQAGQAQLSQSSPQGTCSSRGKRFPLSRPPSLPLSHCN